MALLAAARRAPTLLRPTAATASFSSVKRMSSSSSSIRALRTQAASLRGKAVDALRASSHDREVIRVIESTMQSHNSSVDVTASEEQEDLIASDEVFEFSDLGEDLQQALHKYIELRGITPVNTKILHEHMVNKDLRRYLLCLTKLWDFMKKE